MLVITLILIKSGNMKKFLLIPVCMLALHSFAQEGEVHKAMDDKYGEPGRDKLNAWTENMMNAKTEPQYTFTTAMNMHIISYKHGEKKDESDIKYYINPSSETFGMKPVDKKGRDNMIMVYDMKNHSMLMLDHDKMTGMAININAFMSKEMQEKRDHPETATPGKSNTDCKKTGKTQTIQGYQCEEYVCKDDERKTRSEIWIAHALPINISQSGARGPYAAYFRSADGLGGMMMMAKFYKEDELESSMEITLLDPKANIMVKTTDYKLGMR